MNNLVHPFKYKYVESTDYQVFLKKAILEQYKLLGSERAELITQMELATLFEAWIRFLKQFDELFLKERFTSV